MSRFIFALALVATAVPAYAQGAVPDLKGTWTGKGKSVVFGANSYHPGAAQQGAGDGAGEDSEVARGAAVHSTVIPGRCAALLCHKRR